MIGRAAVRRSCIAILVSGALVGATRSWPQSARRRYRIGFLSGGWPHNSRSRGVFEATMRELGYTEGEDIEVVHRAWQGGSRDLTIAAADLALLSPDVIVAVGNREIAAAHAAAPGVPIVMVASQDPVGAGFVQSLAHPGGHITGLNSVASTAIRGKRLAMLKEILPGLARVAVLREAGASSVPLSAELDVSARSLGMTLDVVEFRAADDLERALADIRDRRPAAMVVDGGSLVQINMRTIAQFAIANRIAAAYSGRQYAEDGLLFTYGLIIPDNYRRAARYADQILRGARPGDLPVEQPSRFELIINMTTAKAIGVTIPRSLLAQADELIQ